MPCSSPPQRSRAAFAIRPINLKPAASAKIGGRLIEHGLMRELHSKGDAPVWREDESGKQFSLKILKAGRALVPAPAGLGTAASQGTPGRDPTSTEQVGSSSAPEAANTSNITVKRPTKRTVILGLMSRDGGATLDELIAATGWLPHTTRAPPDRMAQERFRPRMQSRGRRAVPRSTR